MPGEASKMAKRRKSLSDLTSLGSIGAQLVFNNLPFILFVGFLAIIYIANAHYAEKNIRRIQELQTEVQDLKREYNSLQSEIMFHSRYTEVRKDVSEAGLRSRLRDPQVILDKE